MVFRSITIKQDKNQIERPHKNVRHQPYVYHARQLLVDQVKDAEISRLRGIVAENSQQRQTTELFAAQQAQTATLLPLLQQIINNTTKTTSSTATA